MSKIYHIFISHAWKYSDSYNTVGNWLNGSGLNYTNYSVPSHDPLDANNTTKLKQDLTSQIKPASVIIIISGMYAAHSRWIDYEIDESIRMGKTIIGLKPWGNERTPVKIQDCATEMINWNSSSLISAIQKY